MKNNWDKANKVLLARIIFDLRKQFSSDEVEIIIGALKKTGHKNKA